MSSLYYLTHRTYEQKDFSGYLDVPEIEPEDCDLDNLILQTWEKASQSDSGTLARYVSFPLYIHHSGSVQVPILIFVWNQLSHTRAYFRSMQPSSSQSFFYIFTKPSSLSNCGLLFS